MDDGLRGAQLGVGMAALTATFLHEPDLTHARILIHMVIALIRPAIRSRLVLPHGPLITLRTKDKTMPAIHVHMLTGRTPEQKKAFIKAIAEVTVDILAVPEDAVRIILTEVAPEHWGIGSRDMAEIRAGMKQVGP